MPDDREFVTGAWEHGVNHPIRVPFNPLCAAVAEGVLLTSAASTAIVLAAADRSFGPFNQRKVA